MINDFVQGTAEHVANSTSNEGLKAGASVVALGLFFGAPLGLPLLAVSGVVGLATAIGSGNSSSSNNSSRTSSKSYRRSPSSNSSPSYTSSSKSSSSNSSCGRSVTPTLEYRSGNTSRICSNSQSCFTANIEESDINQKQVALTHQQMSKGTEIRIFTEIGESLTVKIPAGVRPGQKLRLKEKGDGVDPITKLRKDLYLQLSVVDYD